jgi:hypothetical protein
MVGQASHQHVTTLISTALGKEKAEELSGLSDKEIEDRVTSLVKTEI